MPLVWRLPMRAELYSYQVDTYDGMICAAFRKGPGEAVPPIAPSNE